jgi:hypothetical protein
MAATTDVMRRIDLDLHAVGAEADFLPELAGAWADETDANRFVWHEEWLDLMGRLAGLEREFRGGAMTPSQEARYHALLRKLKEALPILRRLDLPLPSVPLEV